MSLTHIVAGILLLGKNLFGLGHTFNVYFKSIHITPNPKLQGPKPSHQHLIPCSAQDPNPTNNALREHWEKNDTEEPACQTTNPFNSSCLQVHI